MSFDDFDDDEYRAERLQTAFRRFIWEFLKEDAGATCRELLNEPTARFNGGYVDQKPEEFTQRTIVEEVLKALGYEVKHHPVELVKEDRKQPDVKLQGLSNRCVGIAECKALNKERNDGKTPNRGDALKSLEERYLKTNAFARYKKELDMRYLVGIATDGFDWKLRVKDLETEEMCPEFAADYSIANNSDGLHHCYYSERHEDTKTDWPRIRENLAENFVADFKVHTLPGDASS